MLLSAQKVENARDSGACAETWQRVLFYEAVLGACMPIQKPIALGSQSLQECQHNSSNPAEAADSSAMFQQDGNKLLKSEWWQTKGCTTA